MEVHKMTKEVYERLSELANEIQSEKRKWKRVWFFGGDKKDKSIDDYITRYESNKGEVIEVKYSFTNSSYRWYETEDGYFETLKEAKEHFEEV